MPCVFLGCSFGYKDYKVLNLDTNVISVSRNVIFHETNFPFKKDSPTFPIDEFFCKYILPLSTPVALNNVVFVPPTPLVIPSSASVSETSTSFAYVPDASTSSPSHSSALPISLETVVTGTGHDALPIARPKRQSKAPSYLSDYHCSLTQISTHISSYIPFPISSILDYSKLHPSYQSFVFSITIETEPHNFQEAMANPFWNNAMDVEIVALKGLKTWSVVTLPPGKHVIGYKWVFTIKYNPDGSIERYKARLIAKGYTHQEGIDYIETFSPVAKLASVKLVLGLASCFGWTLTQMDVTNAFLHGDLDEKIFMSLP